MYLLYIPPLLKNYLVFFSQGIKQIKEILTCRNSASKMCKVLLFSKESFLSVCEFFFRIRTAQGEYR